MNLSDIAVLVEAVQTGSLAAAARRLGISAMAASRRLQALESDLGARLVHRTTRALALTPDGEAFLPYAQALLDHEQEGRAAVRPSDAGASGLLRITASTAFGRTVVTPMIPSFMAANPDVKVDLHLTDALVDIVAQGFDMAVRIAPMRDSSLVAQRIFEGARLLYASPQYIEKHGKPETISDLAHHDCLLPTGVQHWSFLRGEEVVRQRVGGRFTASSIDALQRASIDGLGISMLMHWNAAEDIASGRLVELPLRDGKPDGRTIWAVYPTARLVPPKVRIFVAALKRRLVDL